jgi:hypothetical protein
MIEPRNSLRTTNISGGGLQYVMSLEGQPWTQRVGLGVDRKAMGVLALVASGRS